MQKYQITLFSIIIALSAFFQYSNTLNHNYVWDDLIVITNNEKVKKGFGGIKEIFTEYDPSSEKLDEQYGYRPITLSSFALDVEIFGLNPYYGHLMSIIYFSILCVVLFLCLQMLFYSYSLWLPFFVTLLFVVHPIHVEVVANIKSRDEILALLFGLLALVTATKYIKKDKIYFLLMSVFSFILAILSKEHLTIFSLVIPLTIMLFYKTSLNKILHLALPFLTIVVLRLFAFNEISYLLPILFILIGLLSLFIFHKIITFFEKNYGENTLQNANSWQDFTVFAKAFFEKHLYKFALFTIISFVISLFSYQAYLSNAILFVFSLFYLKLNDEQKNKMLPFLGLAFAALIYFFSEKSLLSLVYVLLLIQAYYQRAFIKNTIIACIFIFAAAFPFVSIINLCIILISPLIVIAISYYTKKDIILAISLAGLGSILFFVASSFFIPTSFILLGLLSFSASKESKFPAFVKPALFVFIVGFLLTANADNFSNESWAKTQEQVRTTINTARKSIDIVPKEKNKPDEWGLYVEDMALGNSLLFAENGEQYVATSTFVLGKYIKNFFVPYPLVYFYGYNQIPITNFANWKVILSMILYLLLLVLAFVSLFQYQNKAMFFGIMFYIFNIMLFSHFVLALPDTMSDRYMFMPSIGLCIFTILSIGRLFNYSFQKETVLKYHNPHLEDKTKPSEIKKRNTRSKKTKAKAFNLASLKAYQNILFTIPIVLLCLLFATMTYDRNKAWENETTLFSTDIPHLENCARANYYYGNMKFRSYPTATPTEQAKLKEEMLFRFNKSISITDKSFYAFWHLTRAYMNFAMYDEAYATLQKAYEVYPDEFKTHHLMGMYFYYTQDYEKAIEWFEKAEKLAIKNQDNYFYLAWSNYKNGEQEKGIDIMLTAIERQPEYEGFYNVLSDMYFDYGETQKGISALEKVIEIKPDFAPAYQKLISQLRQLGMEDKANIYYQKGVEQGLFE